VSVQAAHAWFVRVPHNGRYIDMDYTLPDDFPKELIDKTMPFFSEPYEPGERVLVRDLPLKLRGSNILSVVVETGARGKKEWRLEHIDSAEEAKRRFALLGGGEVLITAERTNGRYSIGNRVRYGGILITDRTRAIKKAQEVVVVGFDNGGQAVLRLDGGKCIVIDKKDSEDFEALSSK